MRINKEELLKQVKSEKQQWINSCQNKRYRFRDQLKLYNDQVKDQEKVSVNTLYSAMRLKQAIRYSDEIKVQFIWRLYEDVDQANNWSKLARYSRDEMWLDVIELKRGWNQDFYWVWIERFVWWDDENDCAIVDAPSIMTWIPDPLWYVKAENFRFMGFETWMTRETMKDLGFKNIDNFKKLDQWQFYNWNPYNRMGTNVEIDNNEDMRYYYVYDHFCIYKGKRVMVSTDFDTKEIWRIVVMEDFIGKNVCPIVLYYDSPEELNPYWTSLTDQLEDKQRALSKLVNLAIRKATRNSLWWHRLYNKDLIPNRTDLAQLTEEPKLIWISLRQWDSLQNALYEVQYQQVNNDNNTVQQDIHYYSKIATWIDPLTMWISAPWTQTLWEAQQMQTNANLVLSYGQSVSFIWEQDFWYKWLLITKKNLKVQKVIRITNDMWTQYITITNDKIKTKKDPDIKIVSKKEQDSKNNEQNAKLQALIPFLQQEWWFAWKYWLRKMFYNITDDMDEAKLFIKESWAELEAKQQLILLNKNMDIDLESIDVQNDDHYLYLSIYRQAIDTPAKWKAVQARIEAIKQQEKLIAQQWQQQMAWMQGQNIPQWWQQGWLVNSASNMIMANSMQQKKPVVTTWEVAAQ